MVNPNEYSGIQGSLMEKKTDIGDPNSHMLRNQGISQFASGEQQRQPFTNIDDSLMNSEMMQNPHTLQTAQHITMGGENSQIMPHQNSPGQQNVILEEGIEQTDEILPEEEQYYNEMEDAPEEGSTEDEEQVASRSTKRFKFMTKFNRPFLSFTCCSNFR